MKPELGRSATWEGEDKSVDEVRRKSGCCWAGPQYSQAGTPGLSPDGCTVPELSQN